MVEEMVEKKKEEKLVCVDCGRILKPEEEGYTWGRCQFCQKPVCFEDTHYRAVYKRGLYLDNYVEAIRLCKKCYAERR